MVAFWTSVLVSRLRIPHSAVDEGPLDTTVTFRMLALQAGVLLPPVPGPPHRL